MKRSEKGQLPGTLTAGVRGPCEKLVFIKMGASFRRSATLLALPGIPLPPASDCCRQTGQQPTRDFSTTSFLLHSACFLLSLPPSLSLPPKPAPLPLFPRSACLHSFPYPLSLPSCLSYPLSLLILKGLSHGRHAHRFRPIVELGCTCGQARGSDGCTW